MHILKGLSNYKYHSNSAQPGIATPFFAVGKGRYKLKRGGLIFTVENRYSSLFLEHLLQITCKCF